MNEAVLQEIEEHSLTPEAIEAVIEASEQDDVRVARQKLETERQDVERRITRVVAAIEAGGEVTSLVAKVRELEARKATIGAELTRLQPIPRLDPKIVGTRLAEWRRLLRASITQGRTVLQRVIDGRITFTPLEDEFELGQTGYTFSAQTRYDKLFCGIATPRPKDTDDRTGLDGIGETRIERDYGRLLEQALCPGGNKGKGGGAPGRKRTRCRGDQPRRATDEDRAKPARAKREMVSLNFTSWNQITDWLRAVNSVRRAA